MEMPCMIDFKDKRVVDICSRMQKASKKSQLLRTD